jgi:hypothetical protein
MSGITQLETVPLQVYRASQLADDVIGGARRSPYYLQGTHRTFITAKRATVEMRVAGLTADKLFDAIVWPSSADIQQNDIVIPTEGNWANQRMLVTAVTSPSLDSRQLQAVKHLQLERWDDGKALDLRG